MRVQIGETTVAPLHAFGHTLADGSGVIRCMQCSGVFEVYFKGLYSFEY